MRRRHRIRALYLSLAAALACGQTSPPPLTELPAYQPSYGDGFSGERCWQDLKALTEIGPRVTGGEGSRRAREYIRGQLEALGLEVEAREWSSELGEGQEPLVGTNLWADIPGESSDLVVLAAPYDTRPYESFVFVGANDGGSGAALLLELARALVQNPIHYTAWLLFLDGEAPRPLPQSEKEVQLLGSSSLAQDLLEEGQLANVRLFVFFNQVADADLRIARDLYSHRLYREEFWEAAERLQHTQAFPSQRAFESVRGSHHPFRAVGLSRVVAIVDTSYGGDEPPGVYAGSEEDTLEHLSPESLRVVGEVTLDALDHISRRLAKIDRFSRAPLEEEFPPLPPPPPAQAPAQEGADAAPADTSETSESETPAPEAPGGGSAAEWEGEPAPPTPAEDAKPAPPPSGRP